MSNNFVTFATSSILKSEEKLANLMNESMSDWLNFSVVYLAEFS